MLMLVTASCREAPQTDFASTLTGEWSEHPFSYGGLRFTLTQQGSHLDGRGVATRDVGPDYEDTIHVSGITTDNTVSLNITYEDGSSETRTYMKKLTRFNTTYLDPLTNAYRILIRQAENDALMKREAQP